MEKFEAFIKAILKIIFRETPFDQEKANTSLEEIKKSYKESSGKDDGKTSNIFSELG